MNIKVNYADSSWEAHYARAIFNFRETIVDSGLLNAEECLALAESLRQGADALEHYSRIIAEIEKKENNEPENHKSLKNLKEKDLEIIDTILTYIGSNTSMQDEIAKFIFDAHGLTEDQFDEWLMTTELIPNKSSLSD